MTSLAKKLGPLEAQVLKSLENLSPGFTTGDITVSTASAKGSHHLLIVQGKGRDSRLFVKGPGIHDGIHQRLDLECQLLRDVAPTISALHPDLRCPRLVGYDPGHRVLIMEMVDGVPLYKLLFGTPIKRGRSNVLAAVGKCGSWLRAFHYATATAKNGNPFDHLSECFSKAYVNQVLSRFADARAFDRCRVLLDEFAVRNRGCSQPVCRLHGEFAPYHILCRDDAIYVLDFGSTRMGFWFEDVAFFLAIYRVLLPWRLLAGKIRLPLALQRGTFLEGYGLMPQNPTLAQVLLRFAEINAVLLYLAQLEAQDTSKRAVYARVAFPFLHRRFKAMCTEHAVFLQSRLTMPDARLR